MSFARNLRRDRDCPPIFDENFCAVEAEISVASAKVNYYANFWNKQYHPSKVGSAFHEDRKDEEEKQLVSPQVQRRGREQMDDAGTSTFNRRCRTTIELEYDGRKRRSLSRLLHLVRSRHQ